MPRAASRSENKSFVQLIVFLALIVSVIFVWRYGDMIASGAGGAKFGDDYAVFHHAARFFEHGDAALLYDNKHAQDFFSNENLEGESNYHPYLNPPYFLFFLAPLQFFSYDTGLVVFTVFQLLLWLLVLRSGAVKSLWPRLSQSRYALLIGAGISLPFLVNTALVGQVGTLYASALLFGFAQLKRRPILAGIVLAVLACKPTLGLIVPIFLLAARHYRALFSCALTTLAMMLATVFLWGLPLWEGWIEASIIHSGLLGHETLPEKFRIQMTSLHSGLLMLGLPALVASILQFIAMIWGIATVVAYARKSPFMPEMFGLVFSSIFLISAYVLQYDAVILSVVLLLLANECLDKMLPLISRITIFLAIFSSLVTIQLQAFGLPYGMLVICLLWWESFKLLGRRCIQENKNSLK